MLTQNFGGDKQRAFGYVMAFSRVVNWFLTFIRKPRKQEWNETEKKVLFQPTATSLLYTLLPRSWQLKKEFLASSETVSNINCSTVVFILLDFLQTRGVIFYTVSLFECLLLVRFWNEICLSILFYYIFHLLQPCYRNLVYHIYFAVSCSWVPVMISQKYRESTEQRNTEPL